MTAKVIANGIGVTVVLVLTGVYMVGGAVSTISLPNSVSAFPSGQIIPTHSQGPARVVEAPMATSGNNVFMAWTNNDTGHWNEFLAK